MVKEIVSVEEFESSISKGITFVDMFAIWCGPCTLFSPIIEEISDEMDKIHFLKVDVDKLPEIADRYNVNSIPSLFIFKEGEPVAVSLGYKQKSELIKFIDDNI